MRPDRQGLSCFSPVPRIHWKKGLLWKQPGGGWWSTITYLHVRIEGLPLKCHFLSDFNFNLRAYGFLSVCIYREENVCQEE